MVTVFLLISFLDYSKTYDAIVENLTIANDYNISFKESMDESLYKLVVGYVSFETIDEDATLSNPYTLINSLRQDTSALLDKVDSSSELVECSPILKTDIFVVEPSVNPFLYFNRHYPVQLHGCP